ncbi:hypothetical protein A3H83_00565, partial [Candidatus Roizmanbacteria bacterium RIFCSPLOWO2_02_FULL_39_8]
NYRGRGAANVSTRIKNVLTGGTIENGTKSNFEYELADIEQVQGQYLYKDNAKLYFMDPITYDQIDIDIKKTGTISDYLKEGDLVYILKFNGTPISIRSLQSVRLKVIEAPDAVKGDTTTAPKKDVVLETGITVKAPIFIKKGDTIVVNPETGEYVERVN